MKNFGRASGGNVFRRGHNGTNFLKKNNLIYFCLCWVFVAAGAFSSCSAWASHHSGFSYCRAWAPGRLGFSSWSMWAQ